MSAGRAGLKLIAGLAIFLAVDRVIAQIVPPATPPTRAPRCEPADPGADADVVVMGDSQSEEADRGRGRSWVAHLREMRRSTGNDSVVSTACGGLRSGEAATRWPARTPRVVVFWAGWNDLVTRPEGGTPDRASPDRGALGRSGFVRLAAALSRDVRRARREAALDALSAAPATAINEASRIAGYAGAVRGVHQRAVASGTALVLVSPPWAGTTLERSHYRSLAFQTGNSVATIDRMHASLLASYRQLCLELAPITCYDAAAAVDALPAPVRHRLFADPLHWSAEGSEWVATRIDSVLRVTASR